MEFIGKYNSNYQIINIGRLELGPQLDFSVNDIVWIRLNSIFHVKLYREITEQLGYLYINI